MNTVQFEQLLHEEEGTTLDFKQAQYLFSGATDTEKSELLKDLLGFANAFRRTEAYIVVGVEDVRGGRAIVHGVNHHLDDHSLQQFVSSVANRPLRFHYSAFLYEGKQVGIIQIDRQQRPIYLLRDYGKLHKNQVYVRRGSSTDPTKPATPDEIAHMGGPAEGSPSDADLRVEFCDLGREVPLGTCLSFNADGLLMPIASAIPDFIESRASGAFGLDLSALSQTVTNSAYYREMAEFASVSGIIRAVRLLISNVGEVVASDVQVEILVSAGVLVLSREPRQPVKRRLRLDVAGIVNPLRQPDGAGDVSIEGTADGYKIEVTCGNLQPGRRIPSDQFHLAVRPAGTATLVGTIFAGNLPQPKAFHLSLARIGQDRAVSIEELIRAADG